MEIVKFYQEGQGNQWDKLGAMGGDAYDDSYSSSQPVVDDVFANPVRLSICLSRTSV